MTTLGEGTTREDGSRETRHRARANVREWFAGLEKAQPVRIPDESVSLC